MESKSDSTHIIGCDPGPVSSAIASIEVTGGKPRLRHATYVPNNEIDAVVETIKPSRGPHYFAYEKCGAQFKCVGETVFETAAMGGEIRRAFRPLVLATYAFKPSEWRYVLCGQGNAKTPLIYAEICALFEPTGGGSDPYKGTKDKPGPLWALHVAGKGNNMSHMKDALGVALAVTRCVFRTGEGPDKYLRPW